MLYFLSVPYTSLSNPQVEKNTPLTTFIKICEEKKLLWTRRYRFNQTHPYVSSDFDEKNAYTTDTVDL